MEKQPEAFDSDGELHRIERTYSVTEIIKEKWFPVKSYSTVMNYIRAGKLKATDINSQEKKKIHRLKIRHSDAIRFLLTLK